MKKKQTDMMMAGRLLLATPAMTDARFAQAVILMCEHTAFGAMGLMVNKVIDDLTFSELLRHTDINVQGMAPDYPIYFGGPVETQRGFVLHSPEWQQPETMIISPIFSLTGTGKVLQDMVAGQGPQQALLALGYAGWVSGQLEQEMQTNSWLVAEATPELIFETPHDQKWPRALASLGISHAFSFSTEAGRA
ncbi:MAG: DUF179 domain-containing protein [Alphaproteobacteria bacterium]|nr:DUF179 domain-containing protein [Alphaproteobacteria bacterium]NDG04316.1 DUF179 domain-containing protein [Alphaproteobacteria bacterium]